MFATGGDCIKLWDATDFSLKHVIPQSQGAVISSLSWSNDGKCLGSVCKGSTDVLLRGIKGTSSLDLPGMKGMSGCVSGITFAHKAACYLAVAETEGRVAVWDVKTRTRRMTYTVKENGCMARLSGLSFSPGDSHIAVGTESGSVHLLSVTNGTVTGPHHLFEDESRVCCVSYSNVRRGVLAAASSTGAVYCLEAHTGRSTACTRAHSSAAPAAELAFSPINELLLVSVGYDKKMVCYNVSTYKPAQVVQCEAPLTSVAFLPGGLQVCVGTLTGAVVVHDLRSLRAPLHRCQAHTDAVTALAVQPVLSVEHLGERAVGCASKKKMPRQRWTSTNTTRSGEGPLPKPFPSTPLVLSTNMTNTTTNTPFTTSSLSNTTTTPAFQARRHNDILDTSELLSPVRGTDPAVPPTAVRSGSGGVSSKRRFAMAGSSAVAAGEDASHDYSLLSPVNTERDGDVVALASRGAQEVVSSVRVDTSRAASPAKKGADEVASPLRRSTLNSAEGSAISLPTSPASATPGVLSSTQCYGGNNRDTVRDNTASCDGVHRGGVTATASSFVESGQLQMEVPRIAICDADIGQFEDELLSPVRDCGPTSHVTRYSVDAVPRKGDSTDGVDGKNNGDCHGNAASTKTAESPTVLSSADAFSAGRVTDKTCSGHMDPSMMSPLHCTAPTSDIAMQLPSTDSSADEVKSTGSVQPSNSLIYNKENIPLPPQRDRGRSGDGAGDSSYRVGIRSSSLPTTPRSYCVRPLTPANRTVMPHSPDGALLSPRSQETKATPGSSATIEELQKKYHSIVARMDQEDKCVEKRPTEGCATRHPDDLTAVIGGVDLERLADLVAARLSAAGVGAATAASVPTSPSSAFGEPASLLASLVRSCVSDVVEELEMNVNRRFVHFHYTMLTLLRQQTHDIEELHKKYSPNEEVLQENLRLQEELSYLRHTY